MASAPWSPLYFWVLFFLILLQHHSLKPVHCWAKSFKLCPIGQWFSTLARHQNHLERLILKYRAPIQNYNLVGPSVQFNHSVVSDSLRPHESQHTRPPCSSPTPGVHANSHPSSRWCHPAISSSVVPFSSCPQSLPASGFFPMSQLFAWGGQSTEISALASFLPKNTQDWSPLGWTGWISL